MSVRQGGLFLIVGSQEMNCFETISEIAFRIYLRFHGGNDHPHKSSGPHLAGIVYG